MSRRRTFTEADIQAAAALHEQLRRWLEVTCPDTNTHVVVTALSYEIGRIAGIGTLGQPESDIARLRIVFEPQPAR